MINKMASSADMPAATMKMHSKETIEEAGKATLKDATTPNKPNVKMRAAWIASIEVYWSST
jgi:hypothetical protein